MPQSLAADITKAASKQTYYTIKFLVDRPHREDAYRAYAYFRWVDDLLDADGCSGPSTTNAERTERKRFLDRQSWLLDTCLRGEAPRDVNPQEMMLVELTQHAPAVGGGLRAYLRNMMRVMEFDVSRRGKLISHAELNRYTHWLAVAVTEALDYFLGNGAVTPHDQTRYLGASAAHIMHMLRDTYDDVRVGYYNIPREVLEANGIGPLDVASEAYRAWVKSRVQLSGTYFDAGSAYLARVPNVRYRLAGLAYIARFEWLCEALEANNFRVRPEYSERHGIGTALRMARFSLSGMVHLPQMPAPPRPIASQPHGKL